MRVDVNMKVDQEFNCNSWWAKSPDFLLTSLRQQLEAAAAIWPELADYKIEKRKARSKATGGAAGGVARAAALTPERRSEIAKEASKARWGTNAGSVR